MPRTLSLVPNRQMILSQLSLLSGVWLPTSSGRPGWWVPPPQPRAAASQIQAPGQGSPAFPVPSFVLCPWQLEGLLGPPENWASEDRRAAAWAGRGCHCVSATRPMRSGLGNVQSCALHSSKCMGRGRQGLGFSVDRAQAVAPDRFGISPASFT